MSDALFDETGENQDDNQARAYQVLARKYRPRTFDDLIGQDVMVRTLTNAFASGRIAHAFILTGVRGVGKTTTARILARALNYSPPEDEEGGESEDKPSFTLEKPGRHCAEIMGGTHVDVIEMDAASNTGIDNIRNIIEAINYPPSTARYKIYIIDEVHMLSRSSFNGLLKTLEEPPPYVKFIFATTEIRTVPITVLSRCQRFDLRRLTLDETSTLLRRICEREQVPLNDETLAVIARAADGSARDALSLLDRAFAHAGKGGESGDGESGESAGADDLNADTMRGLLGMANRERIFDLFEHLLRGDITAALKEFEDHYNLGTEPAVVLADLAELTYWLTRIKFIPEAGQDVTFSEAVRARGREAAQKLSTRTLSRVWQILLQGCEELRFAANSRAAAEMVLIRLAHLSQTPSPEELIKEYEKHRGNGSASASASASASGASPSSSASPASHAPTNVGALAVQSRANVANKPRHLQSVKTETQEEAHESNPHKDILSDPQVKTLLAAFPGAEVKEVVEFLDDTESDSELEEIEDIIEDGASDDSD